MELHMPEEIKKNWLIGGLIVACCSIIGPMVTAATVLTSQATWQASVDADRKAFSQSLTDTNAHLAAAVGDFKTAIDALRQESAARVAVYAPRIDSLEKGAAIVDERLGNMIDANARRDARFDKFDEKLDAVDQKLSETGLNVALLIERSGGKIGAKDMQR